MSIYLSPKLRQCTDDMLLHWCPGCNHIHGIDLKRWTFNGNLESPTFSPSFNIVGQCHYFIQGGMLVYCTDCVHELAGKNVELPDFPETDIRPITES